MNTTEHRPAPVAGPLFREVRQLQMEGVKRRKTLALIAAFADGGQDGPTLEELAERLKVKPRNVVGLVRRLQSDGYLAIEWSRREPVRYELTLPNDGAQR